MIAHAPMLLALLGTALMAIVIFAPQERAAAVGVSFAPPVLETLPEPAPYLAVDVPPAPLRPPVWPALIDRRGAGCGPAERLALVDALAAVRRPWAAAILVQARDDENDALVLEAIEHALGAPPDFSPPL